MLVSGRVWFLGFMAQKTCQFPHFELQLATPTRMEGHRCWVHEPRAGNEPWKGPMADLEKWNGPPWLFLLLIFLKPYSIKFHLIFLFPLHPLLNLLPLPCPHTLSLPLLHPLVLPCVFAFVLAPSCCFCCVSCSVAVVVAVAAAAFSPQMATTLGSYLGECHIPWPCLWPPHLLHAPHWLHSLHSQCRPNNCKMLGKMSVGGNLAKGWYLKVSPCHSVIQPLFFFIFLYHLVKSHRKPFSSMLVFVFRKRHSWHKFAKTAEL